MVKNNYKQVKWVLWVILIANMAVAVLKMTIGTMINSASMTADGFHSLTDGTSNIVGLIGISIASKPIDEDHPYGHTKYETITGLFICGMLFFIGAKIIYSSFLRFLHPSTPQVNTESLIVMVVTLIVNFFVCTYEFRKGKSLDSLILISDSAHTRSDIYVSIGVLAALIGIKIGLPPIIDPIASIIVAFFILHAALEIFQETNGILVDKVAIDEELIKQKAMRFDHVCNVHKIRSRGSLANLYIDMHVMVDPEMSVAESHHLIHEIEIRIREEVNETAQVIVHIEPYYEPKKVMG